MIVRLRNIEQRREVLGKKKSLKERKKRIKEDWTWKEKKMRWIGGSSKKREEIREKSMVRLWKDKNKWYVVDMK